MMRSRTLVQTIEDHSEPIAARVIRLIRHDHRLCEIQKLPEFELRDRALEVLKNLGHWLAAGSGNELAAHYEQVGRHRFEEAISLHETVRCFHTLKQSMIDFIREQGMAQNPVELYAEEELEHRIGHFFDHIIYHVIRGYEQALREAVRLTH